MAYIIRARAPLRLGLAGGGTDVSPYCDLYGGSIMNATIDLFAFATIELLNTPQVIFRASDQEVLAEYPLIAKLPMDGRLDLLKAVYNRVISQFNQNRPLAMRLTTYTDAPPGSGLGSSSTLVVAVLKAFTEAMSLPLGEYDMAKLAYDIERKDMALAGGKQDQYAATFGGFNFMEFYADDRVIVNPLRVKPWVVSELESSLVLYFTGVSRESANIIAQQSNNVTDKNERSIEAMHALKRESVAMKEAILRGDLRLFADSMNTGWESKKQTATGVSSSAIEEAEAVAKTNGAYACKVSGAGGGGFMFFFVPMEERPRLVRALRKIPEGRLLNCHFSFEGAQAWRV